MSHFGGKMGVLRRLFTAGQMLQKGVLDLLLPNVCGGCRKAVAEEDGLCEACSVRLLSLVSLPYCPRCGSTIGPNIPIYPGGCSQCPNPLMRVSRVVRLGPYTRPLREVIRRLKYRGDTAMVRRLGQWLGEVFRASDKESEPEVIVPVPMYWTRRFRRGADHAGLIAEALAAELSLPVDTELVRIRNTPQQAQITRSERMANVRNAFRAANPPAIAGVNVLLVDDVTTTGATANECARTLLRAGAEHVSLAVVAKAEPPVSYTQHWEA
jgi:ComF family protein